MNLSVNTYTRTQAYPLRDAVPALSEAQPDGCAAGKSELAKAVATSAINHYMAQWMAVDAAFARPVAGDADPSFEMDLAHGQETILLAAELARLKEVVARREMLASLSDVASSSGLLRADLASHGRSGAFDGIDDLIGESEQAMLDPATDALEHYMLMLQKIMDVMGDLHLWLYAEDDGAVSIWASFRRALNLVIWECSREESGPLATFPSMDDAQRFIASMGGGAFRTEVTEDGVIVWLEFPELSAIVDTLSPFVDTEFEAAQFAEWMKMKDTKVEQLQHLSEAMAQRLSRQNQLFSDLTGALTKAMDKLMQMLMGFINGIPG